MAVALPIVRAEPRASSSFRIALLVLAAVRTAFGILAALVAASLWHRHFTAVVAMRPTKEVLLAAGFKVRLGDVGLLPVVLAVVPLGVFGVWLFFALGRSWSVELHGGDGLPRWAQRILPADRVNQLCRVLERKGSRVVVFGRLAVFPSTLMAAAAGASGMSSSRFLVADGVGAALSTVEVLGAGYVLGRAYQNAGPWLTGVGGVVTLGLLAAMGWWLRRDGQADGAGA